MLFQIGEWIINSEQNSLSNTTSQEEKKLQSREMAVLEYFVKNEQKVVSIQELLEEVWSGRIVGDHAIYQTVNKIRKHLDKENKDAYIKTIPKKGYQLIRSVSILTQSNADIENIVETQTEISSIDTSTKEIGPEIVSKKAAINEVLDKETSAKVNSVKYAYFSLAALLVCTLLFFVGKHLSAKFSFWNNTTYTLESPLTSLIGYEQDPEFTQEGNFLIFSHKPDIESEYNLFKKNTKDLSITQLTNSKFNDIRASASEDGSTIVFVQKSDDDCVVKTLSKQENNYLEDELFSCKTNTSIEIELSHDGKTLYYTYSDDQNETARIFSLLLRTKKLTQLTNYTIHDAIGDRKLSLSPDGKKIAFLRNDGWQNTFLYTYEFANNTLKKHFNFDGWIMNLKWKSNHEILYLLPSNISIYSMKHDYRKEILTELSETINSFDFDGTNKKIALSSGKQSNDIWEISPSSPGNSIRSIASSVVDFLPRFANTSNQIAFVSKRSGKQQIWLKDEQGQLKKVSDFMDNRVIMSLSWSPNDEYLLSTTEKFVYIVKVDTGEETKLVSDQDYSYLGLPTWTNDGKAIYFTSDQNGDFDIFKKNLETEAIEQVTQHGAAILFEGFKNKNAYIIKNNTDGLWKIDYSDKNQERLIIPNIVVQDYNSISVKKNGIYYTPSDKNTINYYDFSTQETKVIKNLPNLVTSFSVSNDEESLLYSMFFNEETSIFLFK